MRKNSKIWTRLTYNDISIFSLLVPSTLRSPPEANRSSGESRAAIAVSPFAGKGLCAATEERFAGSDAEEPREGREGGCQDLGVGGGGELLKE